jgi:hypothetical protein
LSYSFLSSIISIILLAYSSGLFCDKNQFTLSVIVAAVATHFKNIHGVP